MNTVALIKQSLSIYQFSFARKRSVAKPSMRRLGSSSAALFYGSWLYRTP